MNEFEIEFLKAMESFGSIIVKEEYRVYHDDDGKVLYVVAHKFPDDNDNWIPIIIKADITAMFVEPR